MKSCFSKRIKSKLMSTVLHNEFDLIYNGFRASKKDNKKILLKHVRFYDCALLQLTHSSLLVTMKNGYEVKIPPYSICYIEKNAVFDACLSILHGDDSPYYIYHLKSDILKDVCKIMEQSLSEKNNISLDNDKKVFTFQATEPEHIIFNRLLDENIPPHRLMYKIAYLLSRFEPHLAVIHSLERCITPTLTEKIKNILSQDLTKQWRLCDLSQYLHMSEINVRKKLEAENNTFNALLLDIRMHQAARMLKRTDSHVNVIAQTIGYTSTSYFIKMFKEYFGVTPKQFALRIRGKRTSENTRRTVNILTCHQRKKPPPLI